MQARHPLGRAFLLILVALLALPAMAAERQRLRVDSYLIDAEVNPQTHRLRARARVTFTALEDIATATFELHNGLRVTRVLDESARELSAERVTQDSTVRVALPAGLTRNASSTLIFDYEGSLLTADDSPVPGLKLAHIGNDIAYLLYGGRWFPTAGYGTNRFTATMNIAVPATWTVIGSGKETIGNPIRTTAATPAVAATEAPEKAAPRGKARGRRARTPAAPARPAGPAPFAFGAGTKVYTFVWDKPGFPGTVIAGSFQAQDVNAGGLSLRVFFRPDKKQFVQPYAEIAERAFNFFSSTYGPAPSTRLSLVELPDDTVPSAWGPGIAGIASRAISEKTNYRLVANTIARQWWGVAVSPESRDDWWLGDGFARFSEARYVESVAGRAGYEEAMRDMQVGALAYDTVPLSRVSSLDPFSPEFQSLTTDKGAVILHMLRWVLGDDKFNATARGFYGAYAGKPASVADFQEVASKAAGENIQWFFAQWMDSTGAPEFRNRYTVFRTDKGFRVVGEIAQDLDLFRMPVELRIDTDGKTETKRIEVVGTKSAYTVDTFGKPRRIQIDPENRVLKNSPDLKVRTAILRGQGLIQQGDLTGSLREFQKALDANKNSSLAHYRIAEVFFLQRNYQAAANAYRDSLNGDGEPKWTEVWSHIQLGKIFDLTGQRERAVNEYRQALQTRDNTQGAQDEARKYLDSPFSREKSSGSE